MRVGVIQMQCDDTGNKEANMATLRRLVEQACSNGSEKPDLLLGPECAVCGYTYVEEVLWKSAEPQGGPTEQFIGEIAKQYSVYFGVSYLEARAANATTTNESSAAAEVHIINTFALAGPDGVIRGRVCKATPCSMEAYFFTAPNIYGNTPPCHVIECDNNLRVGVLICYENYVCDAIEELQQLSGGLDLLLQPFSGPLADDTKKPVKEALRAMYLECCPTNARLLQCPALYCNKIGSWKQPSPSTIMPMKFDTEFPGSSAICSADGTELGRLGEEEEGVLIKEVVLTRSSENNDDKHPSVPRFWGGFSNGTPFLKVCLVFEFLGARYYKSSNLRKQLSQEALTTTAKD